MAPSYRRRQFVPLLLCMLFYAGGVGAYVIWSEREADRNLLAQIDRELLLAARGLKYMLAEDFHDRAVAADSISRAEELRNRARVSGYAAESGFKYVYTLVRRDGRFFFSAPTVTEEEAKERESWCFYPYEDVPAEFVTALDENRTTYVTYSDQWGTFRSVAIPETSPGGHRYLACADCDVGHLAALSRANYIRFALTAAALLMLSLPFMLVHRRAYRMHARELEQINRELLAAREDLETRVRERTRELAETNAELRESQRNLQVLFDAAPVGMVLIDSDRIVRALNQRAADISGFPRERVLGRRAGAAIGCPRADEDGGQCGLGAECPECLWRQALSSVASGTVGRAREEFPLPPRTSEPGNPRWLSVSAEAVSLNGRRHVLVAIDDVTNRKQAEELLRHAKEVAEEAARLKSRFLANVSHEIRTPLNAIIGFAEILLHNGDPGKARAQAQTILREADSLLRLVDDLLDQARIEAERLTIEREPFDLYSVLEGVRQTTSYEAQRKGLEFTVRIRDDVPRYLLGDAFRLRQVLVNLVSNAVKFTHEGSVTVDVSRRDPDPDHPWLRFAVIDTGIGIAKEKQQVIFESFTQADGSITRQYGGTGLGTTISKQLVELMGGRILLDSEPGRGSTFQVDLPFDVCAPADVSESAASSGPGCEAPLDLPVCRGRILIVDDYPPNQDVARLHLEAVGCDPVVAANGAQGVMLCEQERFDVILMDVQMPEMDGYEATRRIRAGLGPSAQVPIVGMTAHADAATHEACLAAGMDDVVTKPVRRATLIGVVSRWLQRDSASGAAGASVAGQPAAAFAGSGAPVDFAVPLDEFGSREIAEGAMLQFIEHVDRQAETLCKALAAGDAEALRREAHSIKGGARTLEATRLADVAARIEALGAQRDLSRMERYIHELIAEFHRLKEYVLTPGFLASGGSCHEEPDRR